jgi:CDP-glycerol glycerophosphotransferase
MKVDQRNPRHWLYLLCFFMQALLGLSVRLLGKMARGSLRKPIVVLYGHKFNGNLLALYRHMQLNPAVGLRFVFLSMDRDYLAELRVQGVDCCWACGLACGALLARAEALVSDHGLHSLGPLRAIYQKLGLRFFDVWHGFGFKGFDADDYRTLHGYDEVWVASETQREQYIRMAEFDPTIVYPTGYGRTDALVKGSFSTDAVKRSLGLDPAVCGRLVLFAPTWQQDDPARSVFPFGMQAADFLGALEDFAQSMQATVLLRAHLNSSLDGGDVYSRIVQVPFARFPDTEAILFACDALVCDWSSIAFDYLVLDRPTFFLDVPAPFSKGHSLGPECRFGPIVCDMDELLEGLRNALSDPQAYWSTNGQMHLSTKKKVWGSYADGNATSRYVERLLESRVR